MTETQMPPEPLRRLIAAAARAPSGHNSQPWLFRPGPDRVDVLADRRRALPVIDPVDRELTMSCGAAIATLAIAARGEGLGPAIAPLPDPADPDLMARIALTPGAPPDPDEAARADAIATRRTVRRPFLPEPVPEALRATLTAEAEALGVALLPVTGAARRAEVANLVAEGDRIQFRDPRFRRELAAWVRSAHLGSRDGLSCAGFGVPDILAPVARVAIRRLDMGGKIAAADAGIVADGSPTLWLLATGSDAPPDWIATGRALARLLLALAAEGIAAAYLNQPVEVAALRPRLAAAFDTALHPQLLLRIGRPRTWPGPSPRRPVAEMLAG